MTVIGTTLGPSGNFEQRVKDLIAVNWPDGLPTAGADTFEEGEGDATLGWSHHSKSDKITFDVFPGLTLTGFVYHPIPIPRIGGLIRKAWVINICGHEAAFDGDPRVQYFVDRGFRTINLAMPNYYPNETSWTYTRPSTATVSISTHAGFSTIETDGHPILPLFLDQIYRAANWIREREGKKHVPINLCGHSGGGWAATLAAAMDPQAFFNVTFSHAGELPLSIPESSRDFEQMAARPYHAAATMEQYYPLASRYGRLIKSHGNNDPIFPASGRETRFTQISNWVNAQLEASGYPGSFGIEIDTASAHVFTETALQSAAGHFLDFEPDQDPIEPLNVALKANGGVATASSSHPSYAADNAINGLRHTNNSAANRGQWAEADASVGTFPDWWQVMFAQTHAIREINVFSRKDEANYIDDPTLSDLSNISVTDFKLQGWIAGAWADLATVTADGHVWKQFTFSPPVSMGGVRILITTGNGAVYSQLVEVEAWAVPASTRP